MNAKVSVASLIVRRKENRSINAISQNFHLIKRPLYVDNQADISLKPKREKTPKYISVGHQFFFPIKPLAKEKKNNNVEFPNVERKRFQRFLDEKDKDGKVISYKRKLSTQIGVNSLADLSLQNKNLKQKIRNVSMSIKKPKKYEMQTSNFNETSVKVIKEQNRSWVLIDEVKSENTKLLKTIINSTNVPIKDPKWQKLIRKSHTLIDLGKFSPGKTQKFDRKILDVSYPYCDSCKTNWDFFTEKEFQTTDFFWKE